WVPHRNFPGSGDFPHKLRISCDWLGCMCGLERSGWGYGVLHEFRYGKRMLCANWLLDRELGLYPRPILRRIQRCHTGLVYRTGYDYVEPAVWVDFVTRPNQHNR